MFQVDQLCLSLLENKFLVSCYGVSGIISRAECFMETAQITKAQHFLTEHCSNVHPTAWNAGEALARVNKLLLFFFLLVYLFYFTTLYWFCHTLTWICHGCTRVPHPEPPSQIPPHPIPLVLWAIMVCYLYSVLPLNCESSHVNKCAKLYSSKTLFTKTW